MGGGGFVVPAAARIDGGERVGGEGVVGGGAEQRRPDAAQFFRPRMDVDQGRRGAGAVEQRIALRRVFAEAGADGDIDDAEVAWSYRAG